MRTLIYFIVLNIFSFICFGQSESNSVNFNGIKYHTFVIKVNSETASKMIFLENRSLYPHHALLDSIEKDNYFLTTASVVNANCLPLGLYIYDKHLVSAINHDNGQGNFFLKPNGYLAIMDNDVIVNQTEKFNSVNGINYGIQSGPMLIHNDKINQAFSSNSNNKHIRSGVGMYFNNKGTKFIVFVISNSEVSFYDFALFFKEEYHCLNALNLESSRSVMAIPYIKTAFDESQTKVCRYLIFDNR